VRMVTDDGWLHLVAFLVVTAVSGYGIYRLIRWSEGE
jgi:hypothetical protein